MHADSRGIQGGRPFEAAPSRRPFRSAVYAAAPTDARSARNVRRSVTSAH